MKIFVAGFLHETANLSPIMEDEMYRFEGEAITPYFAGARGCVCQGRHRSAEERLFFTTHGSGGLIEKKAFLACANQIIEDVRRAKVSTVSFSATAHPMWRI